ncbi:MAG: hypothetical protein M0R76_01865, partial [Proteobacteria bacterium]|nr:hypothetical protein [Pseudomonadota bacterium]
MFVSYHLNNQFLHRLTQAPIAPYCSVHSTTIAFYAFTARGVSMPQLARQNTHQNNAHIHHNRSDIDSEYVVKKTSDCLYARVDDYPAAGYVLGRLAGKVDDFKEVELGIAPLN